MDVDRIAEETGTTPDVVRRVLAAAERDRRADGSDTPEGVGGRVVAAAAWLAAATVVVSVLVFGGIVGGLESEPDGKLAWLLVLLATVAASLSLARASHRRGFPLGRELGWAVAAASAPAVVWSLLWLVGWWPEPPRYSTDPLAGIPTVGYERMYDRYDSLVALWTAGLGLVLSIASAPLVHRLRSGVGWALSLAGVHTVVVGLVAATGVEFSSEAAAASSAVVAFVLVGLVAALEVRSGRWAPSAAWTWPYALGWLSVAVGCLADVSEPVAWVGLGLLCAALVLVGTALLRPLVVVAGAVGWFAWETWAYGLLDLPPVLVLLLALLLALGMIAATVLLWSRRERLLDRVPSRVAARVRPALERREG